MNDTLDVLELRGDTGDYLEHASGAGPHNLADLARSGLMPALREALLKAKAAALPVRVFDVEVDRDASRVTCDLVVVPFNGVTAATPSLFVVTFESPALPATSAKKPRQGRRSIGPAPGAPPAPLARARRDQGIPAGGDRGARPRGARSRPPMKRCELLATSSSRPSTRSSRPWSSGAPPIVNQELRCRSRINAELSNLIDTVELPILFLDAERRIRRFTRRARDLLNVTAIDVGRRLPDLQPDIDVPDLDARVAEVLRTGTACQSEVTDRKGCWYRMRIRPYRTEDGAIDGVVLSLVDIDWLKQHVREAHEARVEAERANRSKDQFLAILSHELRTPLATMLMHAQLLRRGENDPAKLQRTCAAIERGTRIQVQLIDDLLDVSRIVSGKLHMNAEPTDLVAVVGASIESVTAQAKEKLIVVDVDLGVSIRPVSGDRVRLQQVVSNLLTNAIKFTPKNGKVKVRVDVVDGAARIRVEDTGIGIAPAFLPHVFARFTQEDPTSTREHGGLGLGLAIVRHIVEAHGGTIVAESPGPALGATFTVCLPLSRDAPAPLRAATPRRPSGESGELHDLRVLVVDDDAASRDAMVSSLEAAGAEVRTVDAAAAAVALVQRFRPDVLVSDIAMPGEDGCSLIRRIRGLGGASGGDVPALALSALADAENHRRALDAGFQMHLAKPIDVDHLVDAVLELADRRTAEPVSDRASSPSSTS